MPDPSFKSELTGERFAQHAEMLIDVAKREYLADHPGRLRMTRGFTKGIEVRLLRLNPAAPFCLSSWRAIDQGRFCLYNCYGYPSSAGLIQCMSRSVLKDCFESPASAVYRVMLHRTQ